MGRGDHRPAACPRWASFAPAAKRALEISCFTEQCEAQPKARGQAQRRRFLAQATSRHGAVGAVLCPQLAGPQQTWGLVLLPHPWQPWQAQKGEA